MGLENKIKSFLKMTPFLRISINNYVTIKKTIFELNLNIIFWFRYQSVDGIYLAPSYLF